jgi:hypothetical protein
MGNHGQAGPADGAQKKVLKSMADFIIETFEGSKLHASRLILEGHGVAEVVVALGNPAAVEADVLRVLCQLFYFVKLVIACEDTQMTLMITLALCLFHSGSTISVSSKNFNPFGIIDTRPLMSSQKKGEMIQVQGFEGGAPTFADQAKQDLQIFCIANLKFRVRLATAEYNPKLIELERKNFPPFVGTSVSLLLYLNEREDLLYETTGDSDPLSFTVLPRAHLGTVLALAQPATCPLV